MSKIYITVVFLLSAYLSFSNPVDSIRLTKNEEATLVKIFNRQIDSIEKKIQYQTGSISLAQGRLNIHVPEGFLFIDSAQSRYILEELWGNLPDEEVAGMLVREGFRVSNLENDFSFVLSYSSIGYVGDTANKDLNHASLLEVLTENMEASNETRESLGINTMTVTGWAMVPYYDEFRKAVYWANRIAATGSKEEILNYNLRMLGKSGVIKINAVATMDQLAAIKQILPVIMSQIRFEDGQQYDDYVQNTDRISDWSIDELVSGKKYEEKSTLLPLLSSWKFFLLVGFIITTIVLGFSISKRKALPLTTVR